MASMVLSLIVCYLRPLESTTGVPERRMYKKMIINCWSAENARGRINSVPVEVFVFLLFLPDHSIFTVLLSFSYDVQNCIMACLSTYKMTTKCISGLIKVFFK